MLSIISINQFVRKGERMKKYQLILAFCVIIVLFLSSTLFAQMKSKDFTGYLSDVACATNGLAADGAHLATHPGKHTVACMKSPGCMASGYGILLKTKNGEYSFVKFDQKGNEMAKKLLEATKKTDNMKIKVQGKRLIEVENIAALD
jgi:hypothetical protein